MAKLDSRSTHPGRQVYLQKVFEAPTGTGEVSFFVSPGTMVGFTLLSWSFLRLRV